MQQSKFLGDEALLEELFEKNIRPSKWWLRDQRRARKIPCIVIGRKILYDPEAVRKALNDKYTIREAT